MGLRFVWFRGIFSVFFIVMLLGMSAIRASASPPPSAYDFLKPSTYASVELSPNCRYVLFTRIETDKYCLNRYGAIVNQEKSWCTDINKLYRSTHQIAIYDLDDSKLLQTIPLPENYYVSWLDWASNDRFLAAIYTPTTAGNKGGNYRILTNKKKRGITIGGARILSLQVGSPDFAVLFNDLNHATWQNRNLANITNMLRHDPDHIIMPARKGGDLDLWKVSVLTGKAKKIAGGKDGTFYWFTDKDGKPILRFDCLGSRRQTINVYAYVDGTKNGRK